MGEIEAQKIVTAYAACTVVGGCNLCPLYDEENIRTRQRGVCQEQTTPDKLREALVTLRGLKE